MELKEPASIQETIIVMSEKYEILESKWLIVNSPRYSDIVYDSFRVMTHLVNPCQPSYYEFHRQKKRKTRNLVHRKKNRRKNFIFGQICLTIPQVTSFIPFHIGAKQ